MLKRTRVIFLLVVSLCLTMIVGSGAIAQTPPATPVPGGAVVREVLASDEPVSAPGQELQLVEYTIPAGARLPIHIHPGVQVAYIQSGVLTYTVIVGEVPVTRASNGATPTAPEIIRSGETTELHPGDSAVERPGVIHYGWNQGDEPVVILATTLLTIGQPAAVPVNEQGTPTS